MDRAQLKTLVPHGYGKVIAKKAGVSSMTVSKFLNGTNDNLRVEIAVLEILAELSDRKGVLISKIEQAQQLRHS